MSEYPACVAEDHRRFPIAPRSVGDRLADDTLTPPSESRLAAPIEVDGVRVGNRFCILPMEGGRQAAASRPISRADAGTTSTAARS
jgi:hypothetical protein